MKIFLTIAWRNIVRNGRRSLITIFSIGFGLGAILFLWGYIDGAHLQVKENFTGLFMGHLQIHAKGFESTRNLNKIIRDPGAVEAVLHGQPQVTAYTERIQAPAFFRTSAHSVSGLLVGIDPVREPKVGKIASTMRQGRFLKPGETGCIVLGETMASNLKITVGGRLVSMAQGPDGGVKSKTLKVIGVLGTGVEEMDKGMAIVALTDTQSLLGLGRGITDIVLKTRDLTHLTETVQTIRKQLSAKDLELLTWSEMSPVLQQWIDFDEAFAYVFLLIVLVVIIAGILNTILMAMLERTREFGMMLALGTKRYQLAFMVGAESLFLGVSGLIAGTALGLAFVEVFARVGVPVGSSVKQALATFFVSDVVYPIVEWNHVLSNSLIVLVCCILVSIYPAWKVSKLRPSAAMHKV